MQITIPKQQQPPKKSNTLVMLFVCVCVFLWLIFSSLNLRSTRFFSMKTSCGKNPTGDVSMEQICLGGASKHFLLTSSEMPEDVVMLGSCVCLGWVGGSFG